MALVSSVLSSGLQAVFDNPKISEADMAQDWANAVAPYVATITPPSAAAATAAQSLATGLIGMSEFTGTLETGFVGRATQVFASAFAQMAAILATGMVGGVPIPPPGPLVITIGPIGTSTSTAATTLAASVDAWLKTGTLLAPPGAPVPWL